MNALRLSQRVIILRAHDDACMSRLNTVQTDKIPTIERDDCSLSLNCERQHFIVWNAPTAIACFLHSEHVMP